MFITWDELGRPTGPGKILAKLPGTGKLIEVDIQQHDIDAAARHGSNPTFTLIDVTAMKDDIPQYRLGTIRTDSYR